MLTRFDTIATSLYYHPWYYRWTDISRTKDSPYVLVFHHSIFFILLQILGDEVASLDYFSFVTLLLFKSTPPYFPSFTACTVIKKSPLYYSFIIMSMNVFIDVTP